jgi:hypothetical protein
MNDTGEHTHHRKDDFYLEDHYVTIRECEIREGTMSERVSALEGAVGEIRKAVQKNSSQLYTIVGGITFLGIIASLILQYIAITHGVGK